MRRSVFQKQGLQWVCVLVSCNQIGVMVFRDSGCEDLDDKFLQNGIVTLLSFC